MCSNGGEFQVVLALSVDLLFIYYTFTNPFLTINYVSLSRRGWRHFSSRSQLSTSRTLTEMYRARSTHWQMI